jgi:hypothetical protein
MDPGAVVVWMWDIVLGIDVGKALGWSSSLVISSRYLLNGARLGPLSTAAAGYHFDRLASRELFRMQGSYSKRYCSGWFSLEVVQDC